MVAKNFEIVIHVIHVNMILISEFVAVKILPNVQSVPLPSCKSCK